MIMLEFSQILLQCKNGGLSMHSMNKRNALNPLTKHLNAKANKRSHHPNTPQKNRRSIDRTQLSAGKRLKIFSCFSDRNERIESFATDKIKRTQMQNSKSGKKLFRHKQQMIAPESRLKTYTNYKQICSEYYTNHQHVKPQPQISQPLQTNKGPWAEPQNSNHIYRKDAYNLMDYMRSPKNHNPPYPSTMGPKKTDTIKAYIHKGQAKLFNQQNNTPRSQRNMGTLSKLIAGSQQTISRNKSVSMYLRQPKDENTKVFTRKKEPKKQKIKQQSNKELVSKRSQKNISTAQAQSRNVQKSRIELIKKQAERMYQALKRDQADGFLPMQSIQSYQYIPLNGNLSSNQNINLEQNKKTDFKSQNQNNHIESQTQKRKTKLSQNNQLILMSDKCQQKTIGNRFHPIVQKSSQQKGDKCEQIYQHDQNQKKHENEGESYLPMHSIEGIPQRQVQQQVSGIRQSLMGIPPIQSKVTYKKLYLHSQEKQDKRYRKFSRIKKGQITLCHQPDELLLTVNSVIKPSLESKMEVRKSNINQNIQRLQSNLQQNQNIIIQKILAHIQIVNLLSEHVNNFAYFYQSTDEWKQTIFLFYKKYYLQRIKIQSKLQPKQNIPQLSHNYWENPFIFEHCILSSQEIKRLSGQSFKEIRSQIAKRNIETKQSLDMAFFELDIEENQYFNLEYVDNLKDFLLDQVKYEMDFLIEALYTQQTTSASQRFGGLLKVSITLFVMYHSLHGLQGFDGREAERKLQGVLLQEDIIVGIQVFNVLSGKSLRNKEKKALYQLTAQIVLRLIEQRK